MRRSDEGERRMGMDEMSEREMRRKRGRGEGKGGWC